jgi:hypothetical protein
MTLIMIGSETALNVFMNCSGLLGFTTYLPLLLASVAAKRSFAKGPFSLGTLGWIPNGFAILYMLFLVTFWCYPYFKAWDKDSFSGCSLS